MPSSLIRARAARTAIVVALLVLVASCSSTKSGSSSETIPTSTVPAAADVRAYSESVCGALRGLHEVSTSIRKFMPSLRADSASRTDLKHRFETFLRAASSAARLGSDYLGRARLPDAPGAAAYNRDLRRALVLSADDYARWQARVATFDTYDRDNWEDELLSFEHADMVDSGGIAWRRVAAAARNGALGGQVEATSRADARCRSILEN